MRPKTQADWHLCSDREKALFEWCEHLEKLLLAVADEVVGVRWQVYDYKESMEGL